MITKAAVLYQSGIKPPFPHGGPLSIEELELDEPGPGEVLIKVVSAGICHSDLLVVEGIRRLPLPIVLGHECAGIVEGLGEGVSEVKKGDHVVCSFVPSCGRCVYCVTGRPSLCLVGREANRRGTLINGATKFRKDGIVYHHHLGVSAFSQYTVVSENSLVPIRKEIPLEKAALFGCAVITGVGAVVNTAKVEPGSDVAVFGIGGVGLSIVQGAVIAGASRIIAVDLLDYKLELAGKMGATDLVNASKVDPVSEVRRLTGGAGADYVFEAVGSTKVMVQAYLATKRGGKTIFVGITSPEDKMEIPSSILVDEERILMGSYMGSSIPKRDVPRLVDLYLTGKLKLDEMVSRWISLEQINEGLSALARGEVARQIIKF